MDPKILHYLFYHFSGKIVFQIFEHTIKHEIVRQRHMLIVQ